ncbi:MAG: 50S ribosomal protein L25 [Acidobacteriia bacterium]|nr:50S ribosomal protein L25 [Terriglobia bacterium]
MANDITVAAEPRSLRGKNEARRLRAAGSAPAVVYGVGKDAVAVAVNPKEMVRILRSKTGHNTIFRLAIKDGENTPVMIVDWQRDPVKDTLLHIDMKRIDLTVRLMVKVPVHTVGEPEGVKLQGGLHEVITREIEIECLPNEIPDELTIDVSKLTMGQAVRASDVTLPGSARLLSPPEAVISHIVAMKAEEAAPVVEGAAPAATAAEPEVIKKGKKEEDEEAAAEEKKKKK